MKMLLLQLILLCTTASALGQNTSNETVFQQALQNSVNSTFNATFYNSQEPENSSEVFIRAIERSNQSKSQKFKPTIHVNSSSANRFPNSTISQQALQNHPNSAFNPTFNNSQESENISANFTREIERLNQSNRQIFQAVVQFNSSSTIRLPNWTISE